MIQSEDLLLINLILQLGKKNIWFTVNVLDHAVALMPEILYMGICGFYGQSLCAVNTQTSQPIIQDLPFN